ncbi:MAG: cyclic nucleotide-binding domain-containing protein [Proteobacteria bacterium]|nr:cyclic nucleotide-binding domain-containing protein [Pseudomonadota bacterium]
MHFLEIIGCAASGAVFATFWMKSMILLRVVGIGSNALFFLYGTYGDIVPIMVLHGCLLPLNLLRLHQAVSLKRRIHEIAHADFDAKSLLPFMTEQKFAKNDFVCKMGDDVHDIYYLARGRAKIVELGINIESGSLVGEIAMFSPRRQRTKTIKCTEDSVFLSISEDKALQLFADNPEFGVYVTKMIVARLLENQSSPSAQCA